MFLLILFVNIDFSAADVYIPERLALVAHAGGAIDGQEGSNSFEAIKNSIALGFEYIELDMLTTLDGQIVLTHDWDALYNRVSKAGTNILTRDEFMGKKIFNNYRPVDLEKLINILKENNGFRVITDTKDTDYAALFAIAELYPGFKQRFIPQVYSFDDVKLIRDLGFEDIIITVYELPKALKNNPAEIARLASRAGVYAVTVSDELLTPEYIKQLNTGKIKYFAHTINSAARAEELRGAGFYGVYTGHLNYSENGLYSSFPNLLKETADFESGLVGLETALKELLPYSKVYRVNLPIFSNFGQTEWVMEHFIVSPFISPDNGQIYLPLRHFSDYFVGRTWNQSTGRLAINLNDTTVFGVTNGAAVVYRDTLFVASHIVEKAFGFKVFEQNGFIFAHKANY